MDHLCHLFREKKNTSAKDALVVPHTSILREPPSSFKERIAGWKAFKDGGPGLPPGAVEDRGDKYGLNKRLERLCVFIYP